MDVNCCTAALSSQELEVAGIPGGADCFGNGQRPPAESASAQIAPELSDQPGGVERRRHDRYPLVRSALAIPIGPGGRPDWEHRLDGITFDLSREGIGLELDASGLDCRCLMVGVERPDGELCYAGVEVRYTWPLGPRRLRVGGSIGGPGEDLISSASLTPSIDLSAMQIVRGGADEVLTAWGEIDVLRPVLLDWMLVCPQCCGIPTFRSGCRNCGSGRMAAERLIHHFACAHVSPLRDFETDEGLVCPKCRARRLVVGSDFEYQAGAPLCLDCHWSGSEPVGHCLRCSYRFPGRQARSLELIGYHVHRLDPLAFIAAP